MTFCSDDRSSQIKKNLFRVGTVHNTDNISSQKLFPPTKREIHGGGREGERWEGERREKWGEEGRERGGKGSGWSGEERGKENGGGREREKRKRGRRERSGEKRREKGNQLIIYIALGI